MTNNQVSNISRRSFLTSSAFAATAFLLAPKEFFAKDKAVSISGLVQQARKDAASAAITIQKLRGNVSVLLGGGGNIAVLPGRDGKLLIDAGYAGARPKITEALATVSDDPISRLINSHWHFDHTDGNAWLHQAGATILAHENTRRHLSNSTRVKGWDFTFPPAPADALPAEVFASDHTLEINSEKITLKHYGPAHTDSDIYAHFMNADIIHVADTFWNGYYPFIDYSTGGALTE